MQGLTGHKLEAVVDKGFVLGEALSFQNLIPSIGCIVEDGMPQVTHVGTNLVGAASFKMALDERDIA